MTLIVQDRRDTSGEATSAWFLVQLTSGKSAWRHEKTLWADRKDLVLAHWKTYRGGRYKRLGLTWRKSAYFPTAILAEKRAGDEMEYLVEWLGCADDTWEPAAGLEGYGLIEEWEAKQLGHEEEDEEVSEEEEEEVPKGEDEV